MAIGASFDIEVRTDEEHPEWAIMGEAEGQGGESEAYGERQAAMLRGIREAIDLLKQQEAAFQQQRQQQEEEQQHKSTRRWKKQRASLLSGADIKYSEMLRRDNATTRRIWARAAGAADCPWCGDWDGEGLLGKLASF
ncbi:unnamed protein product [Vitrella brassicaformis CCMP3155]|uniref:Uncharacterized protein n=1 Tax=Vitrella brassicaformis (strain CCMP3155) TaxID=1169540 RepID=A0A0G4ET70_VITBC|nr:unnamed protein product [Vitrella brassicaformis CCMP3155]|eukprot:CEM01133.1 unnamed protein product [Vitrella brassicaformis CCMP3155]